MYNNIRKKVNKFYTGGKIPKYKLGDSIKQQVDEIASTAFGYLSGPNGNMLGSNITDIMDAWGNAADEEGVISESDAAKAINIPTNDPTNKKLTEEEAFKKAGLDINSLAGIDEKSKSVKLGKGFSIPNADTSKGKDFGDFAGQVGDFLKGGGSPAGMIAAGVTATVNFADQALMGDKNFDAQSQAIDSAVHGASNALMSSGNPIAMGVGAALEGINFIDKAAGKTVQGYDVNIASSGFSGIQSEQSSSSYRGSQFKKLDNALGRRNEQLRMAMSAADITDEENFMQEARMNSIENTVMNNQIALAGGLSTSMLGD